MNLFNESLCEENQQSKKEFACHLTACLETLAPTLTGLQSKTDVIMCFTPINVDF